MTTTFSKQATNFKSTGDPSHFATATVASKVAPFHDATFFCAATKKEAIVWLVQARPGC